MRPGRRRAAASCACSPPPASTAVRGRARADGGDRSSRSRRGRRSTTCTPTRRADRPTATSPRPAARARTSAGRTIWRRVGSPAAAGDAVALPLRRRRDCDRRDDRVVRRSRPAALAAGPAASSPSTATPTGSSPGQRRVAGHRRRRACGVRFALAARPPASTSSGSASGSTRSTSAGRALDAVVFEQYKTRAHRTLPADAVRASSSAASGWGFHVRTSRRDLVRRRRRRPGPAASSRSARRPGRDRAVERAAVRRRPRPRCSRAFLDEVGRPRAAAGLGVPAVGERQRVEHPGARPGRGRAQREPSIPVGVVVIEAWSDESTFTAFRDARYDVARRRRAAPPRRLRRSRPTAPGPTRRAWSTSCTQRGVKVLLWQIPLVTRPHRGDDGQVAADAGDDDRARLLRRARRDGTPYRNRGWWFPRRAAARLDQPRGDATGGWRSAATCVEEVGVDGFKTDGGEHAWGDDLRYADGTPRRRRATTCYPRAYAEAYRELLARLRRRRRDVQPGRVHRRRRARRATGPATRTRPGRRSGPRSPPGSPPRLSGVVFWGWDLAGFSGRDPDAELYLRAAAMAALVPDHAVPLGVQPPPHAVARPHAVEHRRAPRRRRALDAVPAVRRAARAAACRTSSRQAERTSRPAAADAAAVLRPPRRPAVVGRAHAVPARRRPARRPGVLAKDATSSTSTCPPARGSTPGRARATSARHGCHEQSRGTRSPRTSAPTGRQPCGPRSSICPASRSA